MVLFTDKPIETRKNDTLCRSHFADMIAEYLLSSDTGEGCVLSINGSWGCGKTSIINMIKESLRSREITEENYAMPVYIDFSPWNATEQSQLIRQFLNVLSDSFNSKRVLKILDKSLSIISQIIKLSPLPSLIKDVIKKVDSSYKQYKEAIEKSKQEIENYKNSIVTNLKQSYVRYIVFIDDIDRLNNEEIKLLIQLIKSVCDFPNVTYVLCYDKDIVAGALKNVQTNVDGYKYLEKIVQMEFNVPSIKESKMKRIAVSDLVETINGCTDKDLHNINTYVGFGLFSQLSNIREEKRYINSLKFAIQCHKNEIDLADLCVITYLRNLDENVFKLILEYRDYILDKGPVNFESKIVTTTKETFFEKLDNTKYDRKKSKFLLQHLFPNMFSINRSLAPSRLETKRLANKNKFDYYLQMELDDNDIPAERLNAVLELDSVQALRDLAGELDRDQMNSLLITLESVSMDLMDEEKIVVLTEFAFNYLSDYQYEEGDYEYLKERVIRIICTNMVQNIGLKRSEALLAGVVSKTSDFLSLIAFYYLVNENGDFRRTLSGFSNSFKDMVLLKTKEVLISNLKKTEFIPAFSAFGVTRFLINQCKEELTKVVKGKDASWICKFMSSTIYLGSCVSKTTRYSYLYDEDLLSMITKETSIDIASLKVFASSNKEKQRIIAIEMQSRKEPFSTGDRCYYCDDIANYCNREHIDFKPSDKYEKIGG